jgi:hypothetical protein
MTLGKNYAKKKDQNSLLCIPGKMGKFQGRKGHLLPSWFSLTKRVDLSK